MTYFAKNIKKLRNEKNLTQEILSEKFNIERTTISKWENEKMEPNLDTLIRISDFFDVSIDEMLKGEYNKKTMLDELISIREKFDELEGKLAKLEGVSNKSIDELTKEVAQGYMDIGVECLKKQEYSEAVEYFEKAAILGDMDGYYNAILTYQKMQEYYLEIGDVEEYAWCQQQINNYQMRMMK